MDSEQYTVEGIEAHRIRVNAITRQRRHEYFVKWLDYGGEHNTWEPLWNIRENCSNLIVQYHRDHPEAGPSPVLETAGKSINRGSATFNQVIWPTSQIHRGTMVATQIHRGTMVVN